MEWTDGAVLWLALVLMCFMLCCCMCATLHQNPLSWVRCDWIKIFDCWGCCGLGPHVKERVKITPATSNPPPPPPTIQPEKPPQSFVVSSVDGQLPSLVVLPKGGRISRGMQQRGSVESLWPLSAQRHR